MSSSFETYFTLDGKTAYPHITVYQAKFPNNNLGKLTSELKEILNEIGTIDVKMNGFRNYGEYIFWKCNMSKDLFRLHKTILNRLNPLREGLILDIFKEGKFNEIESKNIKQYGSMVVDTIYEPHITITRLRNVSDSQKSMNILESGDYKFDVTKISLGYFGPHGTITGIMKQIDV